MILGLGLMVSIYVIFLIIKSTKSVSLTPSISLFLGRTTILVLITSCFASILLFLNWQGIIVFMDGVTKISSELLANEICLILLSIALISVLNQYIKSPETYLILICNILGLIYMITSNDWLITITSWELFNLSIYLIIGASGSDAALSASIKYFLLSALTTGFLLLSTCLLYGITGNTHYDSISMVLNLTDSNLVFFVLLPMTITFLFKLSAAPLHNWAPDLYDGLPTIYTIWIATITKLGVLILLVQLQKSMNLWFIMSSIGSYSSDLLILVSALSLIVGSIGLGSQLKIKRFLAYSSISHVGYLLLALSEISLEILPIDFYYYLVIYFLTATSLFTILISMTSINPSSSSSRSTSQDISFISQLSGLIRINPALAYALTFTMFSLAGIPPLAGFYSKLMVLQGILSQGLVWIAILAILTSALSTANYLKIVKVSMFDLPLYPKHLAISATASNVISCITTFNVLFILSPSTLSTILNSFI